MNIRDMYFSLPVGIQDFLVSLYSYKLEKQRFGPDFEKIYSDIIESDMWSAETIRKYKEECAFRIIEQAFNHCPYYKQKYKSFGLTPSSFTCIEDLEKFPILTKDDIRNNLNGMLADNINKRQLIPYHTSGSTGKALDFFNTKKSLQFYWAVCARYKHRFNIERGDLHLNFTGKLVVPLNQNKPPYWRYKKAQNQFMLNMQHFTRDKIKDIIAFIQSHDFKFFVGYPSIINSFSLLADELGVKFEDNPIYIFSSAEKMYDNQKEAILKVFPNSKIIEHYGFSENAGSASKCSQYMYHEDFELGHLELKDPLIHSNGKTGIMLATGFHNYGMPFIRYEIGDSATFSTDNCKCGRSSQIITDIEGRNEDYVITPEGTYIMRFDYIFKGTPDIKECQVVQKELGSVIVRIVKSNNYSMSTEQEIVKNIHNLISPRLLVKFEYPQEIERTKAGKFKAVVSELNKNKL